MKYPIARVVFNLAVDKEFDYRVGGGGAVKEGIRVWVQFGRAKRVGIVVRLASKSLQKEMNPILEVLDLKTPSLSKNHIRFARKLAKAYPCSVGEFLFMMLPRKLKTRRSVCEVSGKGAAIRGVGKKDDACRLSGVEASTLGERLEVYRDSIRRALKNGSVVICFPLIVSLEYAAARYRDEFKDVLLTFHSHQKEAELAAQWNQARGPKKLILTTRMGLFYYSCDLNLIIVDDESNTHYTSQEKPYYNLIEVAFILAKTSSAPLILGFDYPSLATYELFRAKNVPLTRRPHAQCPVEIIRSLSFFTKKRGIEFNRLFIELIRKNLDAGKRILILYNRQGFASLLKCSHCGYVYRCSRCSGTLKFSSSDNKGVCPWCHRVQDIPSVCPECQSGYIKSHGLGIERLQEKMKSIFGKTAVDIVGDRSSAAPILVSTYAVLEKPFLEDVPIEAAFVLDADHYLARIDFEASSQLYIYLRRLRAHVSEQLYIFTRNPEHYLWPSLNAEPGEFYRAEGKFRKEAHLPPYRHFAKISVRGRDQKKLLIKANTLYNNLRTVKAFEVFGPIEDVPFKLRGYYYYSVIVKSRKKEPLHKAADQLARKFRKGSMRAAIHLR